MAPTRRKLFGKKAQAEFLEWFAATCNISLAARKAGFHYRTVLRHWREDPAFGDEREAAMKLAKPGPAPKKWTCEEAIVALDKRLRALGLRYGIPPGETVEVEAASAEEPERGRTNGDSC